MSGSTFYDILGIEPNASSEDIRRAYRKRALETHPDRLPQGSTPEDKAAADESFKQVNNAYQILTDDNKRKLYDLYGVWPPPEELPDDSSQYRGGPPHASPMVHVILIPSINPSLRIRCLAIIRRRHLCLYSGILSKYSDPSFQSTACTRTLSNGFRTTSSFPPAFHPNQTRSGSTGQYFSFQSSSSSHQPFNGDDDQAPRWVSQSTSSRTVNGVTQFTDEKRDSRGNVHVRTSYPDGRVRYTINGIEPARPPARIPDVPPNEQLPARREADIHDELEPPRKSEHRRKSERYRDSHSRRDPRASRDGYVPPPLSDSRPYIPPPAIDSSRFSPSLDSENDDGYGNFVPTSGVHFPRDLSRKKSWWKRH
ncbi:hypothetical protein BU17DRAFT_90477 [Hysterangium stoloniferum]|nr:hypothetical protein BU17DRAFT_90477 [Hysterangium stoloniferum]